MASSGDSWAGLGPALAILAGLVTLALSQIQIKLLINKIISYYSRYIQITIPEYTAMRFERNELFDAVEAYLSQSCARRAQKLKAELRRHEEKPQVSIDDEQEIIDSFQGTSLWWYADTVLPRSTVIIRDPGDEKRLFYRVAFHRSFRNKVLDSYLPHVLEEGRQFIARNHQRLLFTNNPGGGDSWSNVALQHPANFDTLAMDPKEKTRIVDDLEAFRDGKDYYTKVGKAWKRGYLLFGPPGTGKSTMIAAISKFLGYNIYDLELTAVRNNTDLRKLFIQTKGKSIIVIEDIDRSIEIIGKRRDHKSGGESDSKTTMLTKGHEKKDDEGTKLTLSGMLNFIDGLWSACGGERIIIFTTNNKDKLDEALIRSGRMDMHIEMSYCRYEAFKVLANNYLDITVPELSEHQLFELFVEIRQLLGEVDMSPAEVAGYLMRTKKMDVDACLKRLVEALKNTKAAAKTKQVVELKSSMEKLEEAEAKGPFGAAASQL